MSDLVVVPPNCDTTNGASEAQIAAGAVLSELQKLLEQLDQAVRRLAHDVLSEIP